MRRFRKSATVAGSMALAAAVLFLALLFWVPEGPVAVTRRVAPPERAPERLRLVDLNVLHGYPGFEAQEERAGALAAALAALGPDVVVLQEAWRVRGHGELAARLGAELGMDVAYARANGRRALIGFEEGSAVLSRYPLRDARRWVLAPRWPLWHRRIALGVSVDVGGGETLTVVGTHLAAEDPAVAAAQAEDLARRLPAAGALLVAGDLNAASGSAAVAAFTRRGFADLLPGGIDHVLLRAGGGWRAERVGWTLRPPDLASLIGREVAVSDHPGIVVELVRAGS